MELYDFTVTGIQRVVERSVCRDWRMDDVFYRKSYVAVIVLEGETRYRINGQSYTIRKNNALIFPPGNRRSGRTDPHNPWSFISILFFMDVSEELEQILNKPLLIREHISEAVRQNFIDASRAWAGRHPLYRVKCKNLISSIMYDFILSELPCSRVPHFKKLETARSFIQDNFRSDISISQIAETAGLSVSYFRRLFHEAYGCAPMQYLMNLRIESASELLLSGEVNVTEAARMSGFEDIYYFSSLFRKKTGSTPSQIIRRGESGNAMSPEGRLSPPPPARAR